MLSLKRSIINNFVKKYPELESICDGFCQRQNKNFNKKNLAPYKGHL